MTLLDQLGTNLDGVHAIDFVPALNAPEVVTQLSQYIEASESVRAAVAYWCLDPGRVNPRLVQRLSKIGHLCVDIHLPTDIDILCAMVERGANVYLHLLHPNPQPGDLKVKMPDYLLHPKVFLFDLPGEEALLWVGSHNWTARALTGLNIEASLVVKLDRRAPLYVKAAEFLESIRSICHRFDPALVSYYKWLQGQSTETATWVLELSGPQAPRLANQRVSIFESSESQYRNLRSVDQNVVVSALEPSSGHQYLYEALIRDSGHLSQSGVSFESRLYAIHSGRERPEVVGPSVPAQGEISNSKYWATIEIHGPLDADLAAFELPPNDRWIPGAAGSFEGRVPTEFRGFFVRPSRPLVSRPVSPAGFEGKKESEGPAADMIAPGHDLISRKVLRKIRGPQ